MIVRHRFAALTRMPEGRCDLAGLGLTFVCVAWCDI